MSDKVQRYHGRVMTPTFDTFTGDPAGDWVSSKDYDALTAERDQLRAEVERLNKAVESAEAALRVADEANARMREDAERNEAVIKNLRDNIRFRYQEAK